MLLLQGLRRTSLRGWFELKSKRMRVRDEVKRLNTRRSPAKQNKTADMALLFSKRRLNSVMLFQGRLHVRVEGEAGIDAGGMAKDVLSDFFETIMVPEPGLFATVDGDTYAPAGAAGTSDMAVRAPAATASTSPFESIGRILMKAILDGHTLSIPLASHVWKFILSGPEAALDLSDLEDFDKQFHRTIRENLLEVDIEDGSQLMLTFDGLKRNGSTQTVTNANKMEYVYLLLRQRLFLASHDQLLALRRGFWDDLNELAELEGKQGDGDGSGNFFFSTGSPSVSKFKALLQALGWSDLRALLSGPATCTAQDVAGQIEWEPLRRQPGMEQTMSLLQRYISAMDNTKTRQFLRFVTGSPCLPFGGLEEGKRIRLLRSRGGANRLPVAHTCFNTLEIPGYDSYDVLCRKLDAAILTAVCLVASGA